MARKRVRLVVIVRCPLCGEWIVGNSYAVHVTDVHGKGASAVLEPIVAPVSGPMGSGFKAAVESRSRAHLAPDRLTADAAELILIELGEQRRAGHDARLGFLIYE